MKRWINKLGILLVLVISFTNTTYAQSQAKADRMAAASKINPQDIEQEILELTNAYRSEKGLAPFVQITAINKFAKQHSVEMASEEKLSHDGFEERIKAIYAFMNKPIKGGAENVAMGYLTAEEVLKGWIKSPGHRKNLVSKYTHMAVGVQLADNGNWYFTQIFITL